MKHYFIKTIQCFCLFSTNALISQDVNPFNGSLNYGAPIFSVPSDRGNAVPINLSYGGNGIGVMQPASEVGLGWGLSAGGSIIRSVSGIPDDFNGNMFNQKTKTFVNQRGVLSSSGPTYFDIFSSRRNLDSTEFYYPNYDSYSVSGPGIGGSMTPMLLSYMSFSKNTDGEFVYDAATSGTWKQPQFMFNGDFADTIVSRHYPTTPVDAYTSFKMPKDIITGDCHNDNTPYFGKKGNGTGGSCEENYNLTSNRLATSNFVTYTTDAYGISSFIITNSAGFTYTFGKTIYSNSTINYSYPLNNDYSIPKYTASYTPDVKNGTSDNYYVEHTYPSNTGTFVTETKESNKIPVEWKLTSITGPDYVDSNSNGIVDAVDKGYWVIFDYKLWTQHFATRYPAYGFNYFFGTDENTKNFNIDDPRKRSGKLATASLSDEEVYYLNSITTSTHKAIFVRDVRNDEVSAIPNYDGALNDSLLIGSTGTVTAWQGRIFDEGGPSADYASCTASSGTTTVTKTIQIGNVNDLVLKFNSLNLKSNSIGGVYKYDKLHIYAGPDDTYEEISFTYTSTVFTSPFSASPTSPPDVPIGVEIFIGSNFRGTALTFKLEKLCTTNGSTSGSGFDIEWHAISNEKTPQLNVRRVLLFNNSDMSASPFTSINSITSSNYDFDFSGTTASSSPHFNEVWYQANKSAIDAKVLKGCELVYDYSLANKYHKNINVKENRTNRLSNPSFIQSNLTVNTVTVGTGKLTLNKIIPLELGGVQLYPTLKFDYNSSVSNDNPDFNPMKADYWGYYKSDASSLGYYGYTTNTSKDYTDAWLLRKITSPMGGITEIQYESNTYTKVLKGSGGHRGASRIFPIQKIDNSGIYFEEGNNLNADLSEVYSATSSSIFTADVFMPYIDVLSPATGNDNTALYNYFGNFTFTYNSTTPLPFKPILNGTWSPATVGVPVFKQCAATGSGLDLTSFDGVYSYTGGGWARFTAPVGTYTAFGGGSRVQKIINKNNTTDAYTTLYEYEDGVALNEADRFTNPLARYVSHGQCAVHEKLIPFGSDKYDLSPMIGYSKTKTKNLGQVNANKGWTESYFITTDASGVLGEYVDNFKSNISPKSSFTSTASSTYTNPASPNIQTCSRIDTGFVVEYVDKFSSYWGLTKEQRVYDVNSNILSRNTYEYETTGQGALVENFAFANAVTTFTGCVNYEMINGNPSWCNTCNLYNGSNVLWQTCIKRQYPVVLKRTNSYGMGTKSVTETLKRDEITGEGTIIQIKGDNNTSALTIKTPAFRISQFASMGPKSVNSSNSNVLGADAYYYSVVDSTLTGTGSSSTNFTGASANVYTQSALTHGYDVSSNTYTNTSVTLPYWYNKSSYNWSGDVGSIDTYGLYKKSELSSNPFNFGTPTSSNSKWRFGGEVSLMDDKGHTIETRSFNNKFNATKLDFSGKYVLSQISNCNYLSFNYSGFEYTGTSGTSDGEIKIPTANTSLGSPVTPHTGNKVATISAGGMGPNYSVAYLGTGSNGEELGLLRDRIYRASVWTHTSSATGSRISINLDGSIGGVASSQTVTMISTDTKAVTIGAWKLLYVDIKVPYNYTSTGGTLNKLTAYIEVQGGGTGYFDDFQVHPIESSSASKVYDYTNGRVLADINSEGYATKYTYDAAGRVTAIYQEIPGVGLKLIKTNTYNYARGTN